MARRPVDRTPKPGATHGTITGYNTHRCRCLECLDAYREYMAMWRAKRKAAGKVPHGTVSGYANHLCRCPECTAAGSAYLAETRTTRSDQEDEIPHGTYNGYVNYRCRCGDCHAAEDAVRRNPADQERRRGRFQASAAARNEGAGRPRRTNFVWHPAEIFLLSSGLSVPELAERLGRSERAIVAKRAREGRPERFFSLDP